MMLYGLICVGYAWLLMLGAYLVFSRKGSINVAVAAIVLMLSAAFALPMLPFEMPYEGSVALFFGLFSGALAKKHL